MMAPMWADSLVCRSGIRATGWTLAGLSALMVCLLSTELSLAQNGDGAAAVPPIPGGTSGGLRFPPPSPRPRPLTTDAPGPAGPTPAAPAEAPQAEAPQAEAPQAVWLDEGQATSAAAQPALPMAAPEVTTPPAASTGITWPPAVLPYRDGQPIPPGYRLEEKRSSGLLYGGLTMWAVPYVTGLITAAGYGFPHGSGWLVVPVLGPFIAMGSRSINCNLDRIQYDPNVELKDIEQQCMDSAIDEVTVVALLTVSGLLQVSGAVVTTAGVASTETQLVRSDVARLSVRPVVRSHQAGLSAQLQF
jgi:hypothetical protein